MILAVDGNNLAFASNAVTKLNTREGFPTQALFGFLQTLHFLANTFTPEKIFVAWDGGRSKKRMEACPEYKENRKERTPEQEMMLEELKMQFPLLKEAVLNLGLTNMFGWGVEGDDLIALLAQAVQKMDKELVIVSSDKDFFQLISPNVSVYSAISKKNRHITHENMEKIHGLTSSQWLDFKALVGDTSDNIKGVKGVGEKTAAELLKSYSSLDAFFENAPAAGKLSKRYQAVLGSREIIDRNRLMMDLAKPTATFSKDTLQYGGLNKDALKEMFLKYEFKEWCLSFVSWISVFERIGA